MGMGQVLALFLAVRLHAAITPAAVLSVAVREEAALRDPAPTCLLEQPQYRSRTPHFCALST